MAGRRKSYGGIACSGYARCTQLHYSGGQYPEISAVVLVVSKLRRRAYVQHDRTRAPRGLLKLRIGGRGIYCYVGAGSARDSRRRLSSNGRVPPTDHHRLRLRSSVLDRKPLHSGHCLRRTSSLNERRVARLWPGSCFASLTTTDRSAATFTCTPADHAAVSANTRARALRTVFQHSRSTRGLVHSWTTLQTSTDVRTNSDHHLVAVFCDACVRLAVAISDAANSHTFETSPKTILSCRSTLSTTEGRWINSS